MSHSPTISDPPLPPGDEARAMHTRLRRRMLYGLWHEDLAERIREELQSTERASAWGRPDVTGNLFGAICAHLAALYVPVGPCVAPPVEPAPPEYTAGPDGEPEPYGAERVRRDVEAGTRAVVREADEVLAAVEEAGLWELLVRGHRDTIGLRELLVRFDPDATGPDAGLVARLVPPDVVRALPGRLGGDVPAYVAEARWLPGPSGASEWIWEVHDARNQAAPERYNEDAAGRKIAVYPWRDFDGSGRPVVPYAIRHAERTGYLFDPWEGYEIVEGSMSLGVQWTYFRHLIRAASWPQRYTAGVRLAASEIADAAPDGLPAGTRRIRVPSDPAYVLDFEIDPEAMTAPIIGQWTVAADPVAVAEAITIYERRIGALAGLEPSQIQRLEGDPRSGYAISVAKDSETKHQRRFAPAARRADAEALRVAAAVLGTARGKVYPGRGYAIEYYYELEERRRKAAEAAIREQQNPNKGAQTPDDTESP